jgi:hypothetical protein
MTRQRIRKYISMSVVLEVRLLIYEQFHINVLLHNGVFFCEDTHMELRCKVDGYYLELKVEGN